MKHDSGADHCALRDFLEATFNKIIEQKKKTCLQSWSVFTWQQRAE